MLVTICGHRHQPANVHLHKRRYSIGALEPVVDKHGSEWLLYEQRPRSLTKVNPKTSRVHAMGESSASENKGIGGHNHVDINSATRKMEGLCHRISG